MSSPANGKLYFNKPVVFVQTNAKINLMFFNEKINVFILQTRIDQKIMHYKNLNSKMYLYAMILFF